MTTVLTRPLTTLPQSLRSNYEIETMLGYGSHAIVYRVQDKDTNEHYALKVIEKEPVILRDMVPQVKREIQILKEHSGTPHIVQLLNVVETQHHWFLSFELCDVDLAKVCERDGPMTEEEAIQWLRQACQGVKELHMSGIIHRDLKPFNFLVDSQETLRICDLGSACWEADGHSGITGTPGYIPPEVRDNGPVHTHKLDIYSLGACLLHFVLGRIPIGRGDLPEDMSEINVEFVDTTMSPIPDDRPNIDEVLQMPQLTQSRYLNVFQVLPSPDPLKGCSMVSCERPTIAYNALAFRTVWHI